MQIMKVRELIEQIESVQEYEWVFFDAEERVELETECIVLLDDTADEDMTKAFGKTDDDLPHMMIEIHDISAAINIERNKGTKNYLEAINYYIQNDAFLWE